MDISWNREITWPLLQEASSEGKGHGITVPWRQDGATWGSRGDDEAEEINDFIENKDLYCGKKLETAEDEFNFDDYLYCYKSFHSPFLDKEFEGFSFWC